VSVFGQAYGFTSRWPFAHHEADALALVLELREVLPAVVLALVLAGREISTGWASDEVKVSVNVAR
jgi:hypothetical protein